jgi:Flp pilus assembly protein TadG
MGWPSTGRFLRRLRQDSRGSIAVIFAFAALALVLVVGMAIDINRYVTIRNQVQNALDAAALSAASSRAKTTGELNQIAIPFLNANLKTNQVMSGWAASTDYVDGKVVRLTFKGGVKPIFAGLVGIKQFDLNAIAEATRSVTQRIEAVLVLDNTWSMNEKDSRSISRITALKSAASLLVTELMANESDGVSIGVVPYANYVNVGAQYRNASWIQLPKETKTDVTCTTRTTYTAYPCVVMRDGIADKTTCYKDRKDQTVAPYQCGVQYKWWGCVYSRNVGDTRLTDAPPGKYTGPANTSQGCLNPVTPLSKSKLAVLAAIKSLIINIWEFKPETHIPSGMIWGVNLLSPTAPFEEGLAYDPANRNPRKILVLMTDGINTMKYQPSNGAHVLTNSQEERSQTNADLTAICTYAKSNKIEVFTVGMNVPTTDGKNLLRTCASDPDHAFLAEDSAALETAFRDIARSIGVVRLIK